MRTFTCRSTFLYVNRFIPEKMTFVVVFAHRQCVSSMKEIAEEENEGKCRY